MDSPLHLFMFFPFRNPEKDGTSEGDRPPLQG
jgi:hypothetical protein